MTIRFDKEDLKKLSNAGIQGCKAGTKLRETVKHLKRLNLSVKALKMK